MSLTGVTPVSRVWIIYHESHRCTVMCCKNITSLLAHHDLSRHLRDPWKSQFFFHHTCETRDFLPESPRRGICGQRLPRTIDAVCRHYTKRSLWPISGDLTLFKDWLIISSALVGGDNVCVCVTVCVSVSMISRNISTNFEDFFPWGIRCVMLKRGMQQVIGFWWRPGSRSGSGIFSGNFPLQE